MRHTSHNLFSKIANKLDQWWFANETSVRSKWNKVVLQISSVPKLTWLVLGLLIVFGSYATKEGFFGADSYFFYSKVCGHLSYPVINLNNFGALVPFIVNLLPCNELALKGILVALLGLDLLGIYYIAKLVIGDRAWMAVLFSFFSFYPLVDALNLENDQFALPLIYFGAYFLLLYHKNKEFPILLAGLTLLLTAMCIWGEAVYYLFAFSFIEPILFIPLILIIIEYSEQFVSGLLPNWYAVESFPFFGFVFAAFFYLFWWLYVIAYAVVDYKRHGWEALGKYKKIYFPILTILIVLLSIVKPYHIPLAIPFLSLLVVKATEYYDKGTVQRIIAWAITLFLLESLMFSGFLIEGFPNQTARIAVQDLIQTSKDLHKPLANDWDYGHLVYFYGAATKQVAGSTAPTRLASLGDYNGHVVLTREHLNCKLLKAYDKPIIGDEALRLWNC